MSRLLSCLALCLALVAGLVAAVPAPLAAAQSSCPAPGGATIDPPEGEPRIDDGFVITGAGWGHGAGMSQYGAYGAALLGCTAEEIITTYYPGVTVEPAPSVPSRIRVAVFPNTPNGHGVERLNVKADAGDLLWDFVGEGDETLEEGGWFHVVAVGSRRIEVYAVDEPLDETDDLPDDADKVYDGTPDRVRIPLDRSSVHDGVALLPQRANRLYTDGTLEITPENDGRLTVVVDIGDHGGRTALDRYMDGLLEVPFSWSAEALKAQAITGRSYALDRAQRHEGNRSGCRCDLYDSVSDQVYAGGREVNGPNGHRWRDAVIGTAGRVMRFEGRTATGYYSSSHGGYSESGTFAFGGEAPSYLRGGVDDSAWEAEVQRIARTPNPHLRWHRTKSADEVGNAFGVGTALSVELPPPHGAGGRIGNPNTTVPGTNQTYGGVIVRGTEGTVTISGQRFIQGLGLLTSTSNPFPGLWSTRFDVDSQLGTFGEPIPLDPCRPSVENGGASISRLSGPERVATAIATSVDGWDEATDVVLATAGDFPDALAAGALAARLDAPVLLTPSTVLVPGVAEEISRLGAERVWVLGGRAAVSDAVVDAVGELAEVTRLDGPERTATAARVATEAGASEAGTVAIVRADDWPDAVAAGNLSASPDRVPVLLTGTGALPPATIEALDTLDATEALVLGGTVAVSSDVVDQLEDLGLDVTRLSGPSRYDTALAVADEGMARSDDAERERVLLASGEAFPDALAAGGLAARLPGALVLVPHCDLGVVDQVLDWLEGPGAEIGAGTIIGGTNAVSELAREQAAAALNGD